MQAISRMIHESDQAEQAQAGDGNSQGGEYHQNGTLLLFCLVLLCKILVEKVKFRLLPRLKLLIGVLSKFQRGRDVLPA